MGFPSAVVRSLVATTLATCLSPHGVAEEGNGIAADEILIEYPIVQPADLALGNGFGKAVALEGSTLVASSTGEGLPLILGIPPISIFSGGQGSVYIFERRGSEWLETAKLSKFAGDFGHSLAISGNTLLVGAPNDGISTVLDEGFQIVFIPDPNGGDPFFISATPPGPGAVYVFVRDGSNWHEQAILRPSEGDDGDRFGHSVAIEGDTIVVGAFGEDADSALGETDNSATDSGAAYVYTRAGESWTRQAYLKVSNVNSAANFGASVAISTKTILIGAPGNTELEVSVGGNGNPFPGAAYLFSCEGVDNDRWVETAKLTPLKGAPNDQFGLSVGLSGDTAVIGARHTDSASIYTRDTGTNTWSREARFSGEENSLFGEVVAIEGDTIVVGARRKGEEGAAELFSREDGNWSGGKLLEAADGAQDSGFAESLALSGRSVIVGAYARPFGPEQFAAGGIHVFAPAAAETAGQISSISRRALFTEVSMPIPFGRLVGVAYSTDLAPESWIELGNFFERDGKLVFQDPDLVRLARSRGYYRAFLRPTAAE